MAIMDENLKPLPVGLSGEVITQEAGEGGQRIFTAV